MSLTVPISPLPPDSSGPGPTRHKGRLSYLGCPAGIEFGGATWAPFSFLPREAGEADLRNRRCQRWQIVPQTVSPALAGIRMPGQAIVNFLGQTNSASGILEGMAERMKCLSMVRHNRTGYDAPPLADFRRPHSSGISYQFRE